MTIEELLTVSRERMASDLHITVGKPPIARVNGDLVMLEEYPVLMPEDTNRLVSSMLSSERLEVLKQKGEVDFSFVMPGGRFRVNAYKQRGSFGAAIRLLVQEIPTLDQLHMPDCLKMLAMKPRGLVLLTGPTGSGKSTTLAAMVDYINKNRRAHVITIEDPIEYLHRHQNSMVNQREIGEDTQSFAAALRAALREDPDVILVGEMRDMETVAAAVTAAETGHLVLSTLHTNGAANTVDRIIDVFPPHQQQQIRVQTASILEGVITQQLVPLADGKGRVAALEIMLTTDAIANLIREGKTHQINSCIQTGIQLGMQSMDYHLAKLVKTGVISKEMAFLRTMDTDNLKRYLAGEF
ncbi:type IV pilus twitching motility protein PilT [Acetanaerobacterium elongatum]|uniref:Twitching motility protein PilT n=1 Tax=Acetanaerobacterium elongatum TaxID=258515 RepID=A0A1G9V595_9FIRM|nr:type IV pilus twitching motility protein PilT [Acetanaerobacterium elongatum]SDM67361.1 twitching motility protein PilT [Acetanaerobacterium elongatum]